MPNKPERPASVPSVTTEEILAAAMQAPSQAKSDLEAGIEEKITLANGKVAYRTKMRDGTEIVSPKPMSEMTIEDFERLPGSMTIDANKLPQEMAVKFKEPQWAGHWFNCVAGEGKRVHMVARALGFVPAKIKRELFSHRKQ